MGCLQAQELTDTRRINKELKEEAKKELSTFRILLLGPGDAGKTTFLKQILYLHNSQNEHDHMIQKNISEMRVSIVKWMVELVSQVDQNPDLLEAVKAKDDPDLLSHMEVVRTTDEDGSESAFKAIKYLWDCEIFKELQAKKLDSWGAYFLDNMSRILSPTYTPIPDDIVRVRVRTSGITHYSIEDSETKTEWVFIDVGGQRNERRKWIHAFDNANVVVYLSPISAYDLPLWEDPRINRMTDDLGLFQAVSTISCLPKTWILFLNKIDIFEKKIKVSPISDYFPDIDRDKQENLEYATQFFQEKFKSIFPGKLFVHRTCAVDTKAFAKIFHHVKQQVLKESLRSSGVAVEF